MNHVSFFTKDSGGSIQLSFAHTNKLFYTSTNIDICLFIDMIAQHSGGSLENIGFVFLTRSKPCTNNRLVDSHLTTNSGDRHTLVFESLCLCDVCLTLFVLCN